MAGMLFGLGSPAEGLKRNVLTGSYSRAWQSHRRSRDFTRPMDHRNQGNVN